MNTPDLLTLATCVVENLRSQYETASAENRCALEDAASVIVALVDLVKVVPCSTCGMLPRSGGRHALKCACAEMAARRRQTADLTALEIESLRKAHEYVRVHMAHEHSWEVRDAAMAALSKVLDVACTAVPS